MKTRTEEKYVKRRTVALTLISISTLITYISMFVYGILK